MYRSWWQDLLVCVDNLASVSFVYFFILLPSKATCDKTFVCKTAENCVNCQQISNVPILLSNLLSDQQHSVFCNFTTRQRTKSLKIKDIFCLTNKNSENTSYFVIFCSSTRLCSSTWKQLHIQQAKLLFLNTCNSAPSHFLFQPVIRNRTEKRPLQLI